MNVATHKKSYSRHQYSGPRKSLKRVRGGLRRFHDSDSRSKVWRSEVTKIPVNEEILIDNSKVTHSTQLRTYARVKPKVRQSPPKTTYITPSTNTVTALTAETEDSPKSENEIKVFCPKCDSEVSHTAKGIQEDQTKILIAKVYHYFEQEYEQLKKIYGDLDLTPVSKFGQRTALATGVSETTVLQILKEEEGRNADKLQELSEKRSARKRSRKTDSSSEKVSSDDNGDDNEQSSNVHDEEPEIYVPLAVNVELNKELAQTDPIGVDVKTEPRSDVVDNTNETLALNEPAGIKRRARKIPRSDVTATRQHTRGDSSTAAVASSVRLTEQLDESSLFGDTEIVADEIEIHEEGPS